MMRGALGLLAAAALVAYQSAPPTKPGQARPAVKPSPSPSPQVAPTLAGTVKGPDGKPVEGALVVAAPVVSEDRIPLSTRTDAQGRFKLALKKATPLDVRVEAPGLAIRRFEKWRPGVPLDVQLAKGGVIEGTVRDGVSGSTVPGARVEARSDRATDRPLPWDPQAGSVRSRTDAKGRFRLDGLGPGTYVVGAEARGYGQARREGARPGRPLDLFLFAGPSIAGTVLGPDGKPVPGALVQARAAQRRSGSSSQVTEADGRFDLLGLAPGTYTLVARLPGLPPGIAGGIVVGSEGETRADVMLRGGGRVTGRLVTGTDHPVAGRARLQEAGGGVLPEDVQELVRADAGQDGRFQIDAVPSGPVVLVATARGLAPARIDVDVRPDGAPNEIGDVSLEAGITIEGYVRDRTGGGIVDALLHTFSNRGATPTRAEARSDADGAYILAGLDAGSFRIYASAPGFATRMVEAEGGAATADIVLDHGGTISGAVVDEGGKPVESFQVIARAKGNTPWDGAAQEVEKDVVSVDGRFTVEDVGAGVLIIEVSASQYSTATVSDVKVSPGAATDVGRIRLGSGGAVRGVVLTSEGAPIPGATVRARTPSLDDYGEKDAQTDGQGGFEIRGLPTGKVDVVASHPSFAAGYAAGVDVDPTKPPSETRIVLGAGGRIEGAAHKRDGSPMVGVSIAVQPYDAGGRSILWGSPLAPVEADGTFSVEHVPAGHVRVGLMGGPAGRYRSIQVLEADVHEGETTSVEFITREILVTGRVTRSGSPAASLRIDVRGDVMMSHSTTVGEVGAAPSGPQYGTATTGDDGAYALLVNAPGGYFMAVRAIDDRAHFGGRELDVPDQDSMVFDFDVGGVPVTGVVVDKADDSPVAKADVGLGAKGDTSRNRTTMTGADGHFQVDVAPGEYTMEVNADGYARSRQPMTVGEAGGDLRVALSRGLAIHGRVVDVGGRPAAGCPVFISPTSREDDSGDTVTMADGSFEAAGLLPGSYTFLAGSNLAGFGSRSGVAAGTSGLTLTLEPAGQARLRVRGQDGAPVLGAGVGLRSIGGAHILYYSFEARAASDERGLLVATLPAGADEIVVRRGNLRATVTVTVPSGGTVTADVVLAPAQN